MAQVVKIDNSEIERDNTDKNINPADEANLNTTEKFKDCSESQGVNTVAKHYNELKESGLASRGKSKIFYLRNFNNWIKSVQIGNILQEIYDKKGRDHKIVVLDLCSGKGGDLLKWRKGDINKLVCVDIAEQSVKHSETRYKEMLEKSKNGWQKQSIFEAEFLTADVTKQRLKEMYADPTLQFDVTSCQFGFHYSFESYSQADMMLKNASECLLPGGYFIGTTPNSYEIVRRLRTAEKNSFGNEVYNIKFESEDKENFPLFGSRYWFQLDEVVDCPEFLVYFPALEKMAKKYGLKLIFKKSFAEFFKENEFEQKFLLKRMQALEPYPIEDEVNHVPINPRDYDFAKEELDKASSSGKYNLMNSLKVGTLSQSEWEAVTLYLVFVFQKDNKRSASPVKSKTTDDDDDDDDPDAKRIKT